MTREEAIERTEVIFAGTNSEVLQALNQPITLAEFLGWEEGEEYEIIEKNGRKHFRVFNNKLYIKFPDDTDKDWYPAATLVNEFKGLLGATHVKPETPLDRLVDKASEIVGEELSLEQVEWYCFFINYKLEPFLKISRGKHFCIDTSWPKFEGLDFSQRKHLVKAILDYYEEVENDL